MSVRDLMKTDVPTGRLEDTVRDAARLMDETHVKLLPVCEGDRLVGVLADWDVICAVADGGFPTMCSFAATCRSTSLPLRPTQRSPRLGS